MISAYLIFQLELVVVCLAAWVLVRVPVPRRTALWLARAVLLVALIVPSLPSVQAPWMPSAQVWAEATVDGGLRLEPVGPTTLPALEATGRVVHGTVALWLAGLGVAADQVLSSLEQAQADGVELPSNPLVAEALQKLTRTPRGQRWMRASVERQGEWSALVDPALAKARLPAWLAAVPPLWQRPHAGVPRLAGCPGARPHVAGLALRRAAAPLSVDSSTGYRE